MPSRGEASGRWLGPAVTGSRLALEEEEEEEEEGGGGGIL